MREPKRRFSLTADDLALFSPNTRTCPTFRTRFDAELSKAIYKRVPVLVNEHTGSNPWGIEFKQGLFNMTSDSGLFEPSPGEDLLPLYEGKMFSAFDHRAASILVNPNNLYRQAQPEEIGPESHMDPYFTARPQYWVDRTEVEKRLSSWPYGWILAMKDITSATNERTGIFSLIPRVAVGHNADILLPREQPPQLIACLLANLNSVVFDYAARQKIAGNHMSFFLVNQLPALPPSRYSAPDIEFMGSRVLELVYTAWDLKSFAKDMGYDGEIFKWDEDRRGYIRAELDAYYAMLYGLTRDELRYILDPKDVYGPDFPGETFRVLKEKEEKRFGEYRTRRLVLAAFDELCRSERFRGETRECMVTKKTWTVGE